MSFLDRIAAAITPAATDDQRAEAREQLTRMSVGEEFAQDILDQHRQIEALFLRARSESGARAQATIYELAVLLTGHSMAEEAVVYPLVSKHSSKAHAGMAYEEHAMTKVQLAELQKLQPGTQEWSEKLDHVESAVQQHVYQEESSWLPDIIRDAPVDARERLSMEFRDYYARFENA